MCIYNFSVLKEPQEKPRDRSPYSSTDKRMADLADMYKAEGKKMYQQQEYAM